MTKEKLGRELIYNLSIKPFKDMLKEGIIEEIDYLKIDRLLQEKYHPSFVSSYYSTLVDNKKE